jgi:hypothetical protein
VIVVGSSSHVTHRVARPSPSVGPLLAGALGDRAACAATECSFSVVRMSAQQMVPSEYWRDPDRGPEHRLVITTGATRPPERDAEASTVPADQLGVSIRALG